MPADPLRGLPAACSVPAGCVDVGTQDNRHDQTNGRCSTVEFGESEELRSLRDMVRRFGEREIAPFVDEWDRTETFPKELNKKYAELGLLGGVMDPAYGGSGMSFVEETVVMEELAYFSTMAAMVCGQPTHSLGTGLAHYGSEALKEKYLRPTLQGDMVGAVAVTEGHSGSNIVRTMETTARRDGDDYVLNGAKVWVSNMTNADWILTFATIDKSRAHKGVCAFVLDKHSAGVSEHPYKDKVGARTFASGELALDDVRVPAENLIGVEGEGYKVLMAGTEIGRLACAARAVGQLRAVLDLSRTYAQEREVAGTEIGRYQLIQEKIAMMAVDLEAGSLLTFKLAWLADQRDRRLQKEAAIAKLYTTDALMRGADQAMRLFGASSCMPEYKIGRLWRDAKFMQIYDGTNEIQTVIIAEHELGYRRA